jgi:LysM repeat protein
MNGKKFHKRLGAMLLLGTILMTACTQSYSQAPAATPTLLPAALFVSPLPTGLDPMQMVADFGTQTAVAMTANANATAGTLQVSTTPNTVTPTLAGGTFITPVTGSITDTPVFGATTPAPITVVPVTGTPITSTVFVPTVPATLPSTYTLQAGEWPYCIARRFNVDPDELKADNGLIDSQVVQPGLVLNIPQTGNPFPGVRAWHTHPDTYTVTGNDDTSIYGVACYYGDIYPQTIAQSNNLPLSTTLTIGQQLTIP